MRLEISCAACGGNRLSLNADQDDSVVTCEEWGHEIGTLGDLKKHFEAEIMRRVSHGQAPAPR